MPQRPVARPEFHELNDDEILAKYRSQEEGEFAVPPEIIPDDMVYEWKRYATLGQPDNSYFGSLLRDGWQPVPCGRHKNWFYSGGKSDNEPIIVKDLILMEKDRRLYDEKQRYHQIEAKQAPLDRAKQLNISPPGGAPRTRPSIKRSIERMEIPE